MRRLRFGSGTVFSDEMVQVGCKLDKLAQTVNAVGMCSALAMTQLLKSVRVTGESVEAQLKGHLKQWARSRAKLTENVRVAGDSKQHQFDFTLASKKSSVIAISVLNPTAGALSAAERFGFKAQDLSRTK